MGLGDYEVAELWHDRGSELGSDGVRRWPRTFRVKTPEPLEGPLPLYFLPAIPRLGDPYRDQNGNFDMLARCRRITPEQGDHPCYWIVRCEYSWESNKDKRDPRQKTGHPLERPLDISWDGETVRRAVIRADKVDLVTGEVTENQPIRASNGAPIDPAPEEEVTLTTWTIVRNQATFDPDVLATYRNAVNLTSFLGYERGRVKCFDIKAKLQHETYEEGGGSLYYYQVTYIFKVAHRFPYWLTVYVDQGFWFIDADEQDTMFVDKAGNQLPLPKLLNGKGEPLPDGDEPVYLAWRNYREEDLNQLLPI